MLLPTLVSLALADVAIAAPEACLMATPWMVVPANAATNVPLDVMPALLFRDGGCGVGSWTAVLTRDADGAELARSSETPTDMVLELPLTEELEADTAYTLTFTPDDGSGTEEIVGFRTGATRSTPHGVVPVVSDFTATWSDTSFQVRAEGVVALGEGAGMDLVHTWRVHDGDDTVEGFGAWVHAVGAEPIVSLVVGADLPEQWCVEPAVRELDGTWNVGETVCVAVEDESAWAGCHSAGSAASALAALGGLALVAGRRRR